ncbi:Intradiol ring-cleavage dioxygenase [Penicillium canariense]|uniref:Intradiol ring-cleavage dioxygenase n=1 Tax=Penicillium canariense TaxID=189055 RepID=A0A9W9LME8_9EURO|nr:Intradiol ring-cleavage dioxygenase [Penicillium canariense]KAJ5166824.1 Intradiol ring-cleavage dioxygenase [Penicillium canariense]
MEDVHLSTDTSDGILAWIAIGVDSKRDDSLLPTDQTEDDGEVKDYFGMDMVEWATLAMGPLNPVLRVSLRRYIARIGGCQQI